MYLKIIGLYMYVYTSLIELIAFIKKTVENNGNNLCLWTRIFLLWTTVIKNF